MLTKTVVRAVLGDTFHSLLKEAVQQYVKLIRFITGASLLDNASPEPMVESPTFSSPSLASTRDGTSSSFLNGSDDSLAAPTDETGHPLAWQPQRARTISLSQWSLVDIAPLRPLRHLLRACTVYLLYSAMQSWDDQTWRVVYITLGAVVGVHVIAT